MTNIRISLLTESRFIVTDTQAEACGELDLGGWKGLHQGAMGADSPIYSAADACTDLPPEVSRSKKVAQTMGRDVNSGHREVSIPGMTTDCQQNERTPCQAAEKTDITCQGLEASVNNRNEKKNAGSPHIREKIQKQPLAEDRVPCPPPITSTKESFPVKMPQSKPHSLLLENKRVLSISRGALPPRGIQDKTNCFPERTQETIRYKLVSITALSTMSNSDC